MKKEGWGWRGGGGELRKVEVAKRKRKGRHIERENKEGSNYKLLGSGLRPSFGILKAGRQRFGSCICFLPQVGEDAYSVGSLRKS
jgi:hypothetical protein